MNKIACVSLAVLLYAEVLLNNGGPVYEKG